VPSQLSSNENLARFVTKKRQISPTHIDPELFMLRNGEASLSLWLDDGRPLKDRWIAGENILKSKCFGSADITAKNLKSIPKCNLTAKLTNTTTRHVAIDGLPRFKHEALQIAQELINIASPVINEESRQLS